MRHLAISLLAVFLLLPAAVCAQAQTLLPETLGEWKSTGLIRVTPAELEKLAGDTAPFLREFGIVAAERRTYTHGTKSCQATLFVMLDPTAAYGAFTFLREDDMKPVGGVRFRVASTSRALLLAERALLQVTDNGWRELQTELLALLEQMSAVWEDSPYPSLPNYLPMQGLLEGSERFVLGPLALERYFPTGLNDWPGFAQGAEALVAKYRLGGHTASLLLIAYPSHVFARQAAEKFRGKFNVNGGDVATSTRKVIFVRQVRAVVAVVAETNSREAAEGLLKRISYQETLTMNEPGFRATDRPVITAIYTIIVLTGVIISFAFIAGVAFGGVRLTVKRWLPGRLFDTDSAVEILQLGLSSKPINAKDFYMPSPAKPQQ